MSETSSPARPASLDQIASAREHWASIGLDVAAFDAAMAGNAPAAPAVPPPPPSTPTGNAPAMSDSQAREMASALMASGMPKERIDAALQSDGYRPIAEPTAEERAQAEHDAMWGYGQRAPEDYKISYIEALQREGTPSTPDALAEFDGQARAWLAELRLPADLGPSIVERAMSVALDLAAMDETGRELFKREQRSLAERMAGGPEALAERVRLAGAVLKQAPGAFRDRMLASGAFDDAWLTMTLSNEGSRLEQWKAGSPKKSR